MRNHTKTTRRALASFGMPRIGLTLFATVILIALAGIACGGAEGETNAGDEPTATSDIAEHMDADGDTHTDDAADEHSDAVEVTVSMVDQLRFEPDEIVVEVGRPVSLTIENLGVALHDFTIDEMAVNVSDNEGDSGDMAHMEGQGDEDPAVHISLDGGTTGTIEFTPEEAGEYQFRCSVPGHTEGGMIGTLIVSEA